jgi:hypothetical protein
MRIFDTALSYMHLEFANVGYSFKPLYDLDDLAFPHADSLCA